jgi:serine/threonine protein kinase
MFGLDNKPVKKYTITGKRLGKGSSATVYRGYNNETKENVAVKIFELDPTNKKIERRAIREINILKTLSHPNIIKIYDYYHDKDNNNIYLFLEYCENGCLKKFLGEGGYLEEKNAKKIMKQIRNGIRYLYNNNIFHRDIKPGNILINDKYKIKIADFGLSTLNTSGNFYKLCGSPFYMSPEILVSSKYTIISDIWSLGLVLFNLLYGYHPLKTKKDIISLINFYKSGKEIDIPPGIRPDDAHISEDGIDLLKKMLSKKDRIDWDKFFVHPWFGRDKMESITNIEIDINDEQKEIENANSICYSDDIEHYKDTYTGKETEIIDFQKISCNISRTL